MNIYKMTTIEDAKRAFINASDEYMEEVIEKTGIKYTKSVISEFDQKIDVWLGLVLKSTSPRHLESLIRQYEKDNCKTGEHFFVEQWGFEYEVAGDVDGFYDVRYNIRIRYKRFEPVAFFVDEKEEPFYYHR